QCWCGGALALSVHPLYGKCTRCGTQVLRRKYTEDQLKQFYGYQQYWHVHQTTVSGYPAIEQRAKDDFLDRIPFWHQLLASHQANPRRLLEFGCAHGGFLHYCREKGIPEVVGVEVDEATCKFARENFRLPHVFSGLFPDVQLPFDQFDVICSFDVIEHFLDPLRALRHVAKLLAPGGMCLFQTPCYRGEGAEWLQFRPQEHIFLYNEQSIRRLFAQCDLEVSEVLPGYFPDDMFVFGRKRQAVSSPTPSLNSSEAEEPKKILWARTDAIGDAVLASSLLEPLHRRFPRAEFAVLCQQHVADLFGACPFVNSIICYDRKKVEADPAERAQITAEIAAFHPDLILNSVRSRDRLSDELTLAFSEARHVALACDLDNISAADREKAAGAYDLLIASPGEHRTELQRHADFLRGLGMEAEKLQPVVWTGPDDELLADEFFKAQGLAPDKTIAVCPGAQQAIRLYRHYAEALRNLDGFRFLIFGDAGQAQLAEELGRAFPERTVNLCGRTTLREMAALLRRCRLYVGAETAGAHIACAVGTPNVVVLGGGHFGRFMPYSPLTTAVSLPLDCFGCNWHCKFSHAYCTHNLAPQVLAEAINATLQGRNKKPRLVVQTDPARQAVLDQMLAPFVCRDALELLPVTITPSVPASLPALQFGAGVHHEE
ncbi:MAG TPA: methyltransferase domain-containing protein, partial [Verrucomicrobiae bacterium]